MSEPTTSSTTGSHVPWDLRPTGGIAGRRCVKCGTALADEHPLIVCDACTPRCDCSGADCIELRRQQDAAARQDGPEPGEPCGCGHRADWHHDLHGACVSGCGCDALHEVEADHEV